VEHGDSLGPANSLSEFIKQCDPLPSANYVQFSPTDDRHVEKWGGESTIDWPYSEGLRMDEAMNPLTLLTLACTAMCFPTRTARRFAW